MLELRQLFKTLLNALVLLPFLTLTCHAKYQFQLNNGMVLMPYLYANVGAYRTGGANSQNLQLAPGLVNRYEPLSDNENGVIYGGSIGFLLDTKDQYEWLFGISFFHVNKETITGLVRPFFNAGTTFETLTYRHTVDSTPIFFEGMVTGDTFISNYIPLQPYALVGLGFSKNELKGYNEVPTDPTGTACPMLAPFSNASTTEFAYELGLGLSFPIVDNLVVAFEYRYINLGEGELGASPSQTSAARFNIGTISAHTLGLTLILVA